MIRRINTSAICSVLVMLTASTALAQPYDLTWFTTNSTSSSSGGGFDLTGTVGELDAGASMSGGGFDLTGGFWPASSSSSTTTGACCLGGVCSVATAAECVGFICDVADLLPESFNGCYGDADGNGIVNPGDRGFVAANIGQTDPVLLCKFDMDGNGTINPGDRGFIAANVGLCTPLPDWQNGSGLNHGVPDTRFGAAMFHGPGTSCATVSCP